MGQLSIEENPGPIDPSPEEIAAACAAFQRGWSDLERYRRSVGVAGHTRAVSPLPERHWEPPLIAVPVDTLAELESAW